MSKEVLQAIKLICEEKHIPVESVLSTIEQALAAAYRKDFGNKLQNLKVEFNPENMDIKVFDVKEVVEDQELDEEGNIVSDEVIKVDESSVPVDGVKLDEEKKPQDIKGDEDKKEPGEIEEEEEERFNPKTQIMISQAKEIKKDSKIGDELVQKLEVPGEFGRMAAQTAKQVIIQRLREAEREVVFNEYKDKEGELINGAVQRIEAGNVLVDIGQATAIMPQQEQIRGERYVPGAQLRFYIKSVATSTRGPEVIISRSDKELVRKLFTMEVPEISDGSVEIKSISREPGSRSKIAVSTKEENIDPVGSCVGQRGTRVQFIINELGGEKIDIIEWNKDDIAFIKNALSPAKVQNVILDEKNKTAQAEVLEDQFSLAIGKGGQNVRLASSLVGWKIDIKEAKVEPEEGVEDISEDNIESAEEEKQEPIQEESELNEKDIDVENVESSENVSDSSDEKKDKPKETKSKKSK